MNTTPKTRGWFATDSQSTQTIPANSPETVRPKFGT